MSADKPGARPGGPVGGFARASVAPPNPAGGFSGFGKQAGSGGFATKPTGTGTPPTFGAAKPSGTTAFGTNPNTGTATTTNPITATGAKPAGFGGFGRTSLTTPSTNPTGSSTAATTTTTATATAPKMTFGVKPTASTPGTSAAATSTTGTTTSFAAKPTSGFTATTSGFGSKPAGGFGTSTTGTNDAQLQVLKDRVYQIGNRLHPTSEFCALRVVFYNRVDPNQLHRYKRPENFEQDLWEQAQANNPDTEHLVPHLARGFPDLKSRVEAQDHETGIQAGCLAEAETFLASIKKKHSVETAKHLEDLKSDSLISSHRVLAVASQIEILRARGLTIQPAEDIWAQQLHNLLVELSKPNEYRARLNELSSRIRMQQQQRKQQMMLDGDPFLGSSGSQSGSSMDSLDSLSQTDITSISSFLQQQQEGLEHLIDILKTDMQNMQILGDTLRKLNRD